MCCQAWPQVPIHSSGPQTPQSGSLLHAECFLLASQPHPQPDPSSTLLYIPILKTSKNCIFDLLPSGFHLGSSTFGVFVTLDSSTLGQDTSVNAFLLQRPELLSGSPVPTVILLAWYLQALPPLASLGLSVVVCVCVCMLSYIQLFATPQTVACQAPLSVEFLRQEYWSGLLFSPLGDLPDPGIKPMSPAWQISSLPAEPPGKPWQG